jgi:hypothetical protein
MSLRAYDERIIAIANLCHGQLNVCEHVLAVLGEIDRTFPNATFAHFVAALHLLEFIARKGGNA